MHFLLNCDLPTFSTFQMFQISSQQECIDPHAEASCKITKAIVDKIRQDAIDAYRRELSVTDCEVLLAHKRADTHLSVEPAGFAN